MKSRSVRIAYLFAMLAIGNATAAAQSGFTLGSHLYQGRLYPYYLYAPANLDPQREYPLVLFLHGILPEWWHPADMTKQFGKVWADSTNQSRWPSFVLVPINEPWSGSFGAAANDLLDTLLSRYPIDRHRLCLTGASLGGSEVWDLLVRHPTKFAAAIPVCAGGGDTSKVSILRNIPLWVFHSATDDPISVLSARRIIAVLERAGATAVRTESLPDSVVKERIENGARLLYTEYPSGGHAIWDQAYSEPLLLPWVFRQVTTGIPELAPNSVPEAYHLSQNYPNPFNLKTVVGYSVPAGSREWQVSGVSCVKIAVYDLLGREAAVLVNERKVPGRYEVTFDGTGLASGLYIYRLSAGRFAESRKMVLLK